MLRQWNWQNSEIIGCGAYWEGGDEKYVLVLLAQLKNMEWNKGGEKKFSLGHIDKKRYPTYRER